MMPVRRLVKHLQPICLKGKRKQKVQHTLFNLPPANTAPTIHKQALGNQSHSISVCQKNPYMAVTCRRHRISVEGAELSCVVPWVRNISGPTEPFVSWRLVSPRLDSLYFALIFLVVAIQRGTVNNGGPSNG